MELWGISNVQSGNKIRHSMTEEELINLNRTSFLDQTWTIDNCYCPKCGKKLIKKQSTDIYGKELICEDNHWFYVPERIFYSGATITAKNKMIPENLIEDDQIIEYWLSNKEARNVLNSQLVEILLRILNYRKTGKHVPTDGKDHFFNCLICGEKLNHFNAQNVWVAGLICSRDHKYFERGYGLRFGEQNKHLEIKEEMQDGILVQLIKSWENPRTTDQDLNIHQSLKNLFSKFLETFEPDDSTGISKK